MHKLKNSHLCKAYKIFINKIKKAILWGFEQPTFSVEIPRCTSRSATDKLN